MFDFYTLLTCVVLFIATAIYALILSRIQRIYHKRWTWLTVAVGVSIVGGFVGLRCFYFPLPELAGRDLVMWVWGLWFWHFVVGGAPIVIWQEHQHSEALENGIKEALKPPRKKG